MKILFPLASVLTVINSVFAASTFARTSLKRALIPIKKWNYKPLANISTHYERFGNSNGSKSNVLPATMSAGFIAGAAGIYLNESSNHEASIESQFYDSYHIQTDKSVINDYFKALVFARSAVVDDETFEAFMKVLDEDSEENGATSIGFIDDVIVEFYKKIDCDHTIVREILNRVQFKNYKVDTVLYHLVTTPSLNSEECQELRTLFFF